MDSMRSRAPSSPSSLTRREDDSYEAGHLQSGMSFVLGEHIDRYGNHVNTVSSTSKPPSPRSRIANEEHAKPGKVQPGMSFVLGEHMDRYGNHVEPSLSSSSSSSSAPSSPSSQPHTHTEKDLKDHLSKELSVVLGERIDRLGDHFHASASPSSSSSSPSRASADEVGLEDRVNLEERAGNLELPDLHAKKFDDLFTKDERDEIGFFP